MEDCVIIDIDGTVADTSHRLHHLQKTPKDWKSFYAEMDKDPPIQYVIDLVKALRNKWTTFFVSGRPEDYSEVTLHWLAQNRIWPDALHMRKTGDFRPDTIIKLEILQVIRTSYNVKFAIDDRPEVVYMWRQNGVPCFSVDDTRWFAPTGDMDEIDWLEWMSKQHHEPMFTKCRDLILGLRSSLDSVYDSSGDR